jgi:hypothetical protein
MRQSIWHFPPTSKPEGAIIPRSMRSNKGLIIQIGNMLGAVLGPRIGWAACQLSIGAETSEVEVVKGSAAAIEGMKPGRSKRVSTQSAGIRFCSAVIGKTSDRGGSRLTLYSGRDRQQKNRCGRNGAKEPKKGFEPLTPALRKRCSAVELLRRMVLWPIGGKINRSGRGQQLEGVE